jgi:Flavin containing amine oxidoreductase
MSETSPKTYDTIIIGGGPCGLTLATYSPGNVCLVEKESSLGGCHRVRRDGANAFGEHGPRLYNDCYVNVKAVLSDIGLNWDEIFTPYSFSPEHIDAKHWYSALTFREISIISLHYLIFTFIDATHGKNISMDDLCEAHNFRKSSKQYINQVCLFSDGGDITRYSLLEFLSGFDQHWQQFREPRQALDTSLFAHWETTLRSWGVDIRKNSTVSRITYDPQTLTATGIQLASGELLNASRIILAIPPMPLFELLRASNITEPDLEGFAHATAYHEYLNVCLHFPPEVTPLFPNEQHIGITSTPWGLIYIDYSTTIGETEKSSIVSVGISRLDVPGLVTGKTANECTQDEVIREILAQIPIADEKKQRLRHVNFSSGLKRTETGWDDDDDAFFAAVHTTSLPFTLRSLKRCYTVGCHNKQSTYNFTSMESAVQNALVFLGKPRLYSSTVSDFVLYAFLSIIVVILFYPIFASKT